MIRQLYEIAKNFRDAIEYAQQDPNNKKIPYFQLFPTGTCGETCDILAKYLLEETELNILIYYISGEFYRNRDFQTHAWLEVSDNDSSNDSSECRYIVDITGDQFKNMAIFLNNNTPVYVGAGNDFYELWEIKQQQQHIYAPHNMHLESELIRCYEAILEYL